MVLTPSPTPPVSVTSFDVVLVDGTHETVVGADAYAQEHSMTTFFRNQAGRQSVDCWSVRIASVRTEQILTIRRHEEAAQEEAAAALRHLHPA